MRNRIIQERHGLSNIPEYRIWAAMISRCTNPNDPSFPEYGGRGIVVCDRWRNRFMNFIEDMGRRPDDSLTLDRHPNNDGNYEPGNVRWATRRQQSQNTRRNHFIDIGDGRSAMAEIARSNSIHPKTFAARIRNGWGRDRLVLKARSAGRGDARRIIFDGKTHTITEWASVLGIKPETIGKRISRGWPVEKVLRRPITKNSHLTVW